MSRPEGFEYEEVGDQVVIYHRGRRASVLRGRRAQAFLTDVQTSEPQQLMARLTGNYKRGNERAAREHPRNRGR
jgi:hypothetical protein